MESESGKSFSEMLEEVAAEEVAAEEVYPAKTSTDESDDMRIQDAMFGHER